MKILSLMRASFAAAAASAVLWIGSPAWAGPIGQPRGLATFFTDTEPFGLLRADLEAGPLRSKWLALARKLDDERVQLALCDGDRDRCASPAALRLLGIVDQGRGKEGRARLGEINRAINLAIRPASDLAQYGEMDVWTSPLVTFANLAGDCEDYAITKRHALIQQGWPASALRLAVAQTSWGEGHLVLIVRTSKGDMVLDNRTDAIRNWRKTGLRWHMIQSAGNPRIWFNI